MVPEEKLLEIEIEPGMRDGQEYPFVAEGIEIRLVTDHSCSTINCCFVTVVLHSYYHYYYRCRDKNVTVTRNSAGHCTKCL